MPEFDSPWKEALNDFLRQFLELFFPEIEHLIDWSVPPESLDNELAKLFPDAASGKGFVDRLFKVRLFNQSELWLLIHVEVQTQYEADFPERMFHYYIRLIQKFALPLACLAVIADMNPNWRPGKYECEFASTKVAFTYPIVKLDDYRGKIEELERSENLFALIVLAHLQSQSATEPPDRLAWKQRIMRNLVGRNLDKERSWKVLRILDWMIDLPVQLNNAFWGEVKKWEEGNVMPFITSLEQMAIEKGLEKGLQQGLQQGRKQGFQKGERAGLLEGMELALEIKYSKAGKKFFAELKSIRDLAQLRAINQAILAGATIAELRKLL